MRILALNLSDISQPCERVDAIVVSEINDRLSPKKAPPSTTAIINGALTPAPAAISAASGASATTVPTDVPTDNEIKQAATNMPGTNIDGGR